MGSRGRRSAAYRRVSAMFKTGAYPCHFGCGRPGLTVDHVPPLSSFPTPEAWHGELRPACSQCQQSQGADITRARNRARARQRWSW